MNTAIVRLTNIAVAAFAVAHAALAISAEPAKVPVGETRVTWRDLPGVDGQNHSLAELATHLNMSPRHLTRLFRTELSTKDLMKYAMDPAHPIRIIVTNGHVTLYGSVDNAMDKNIAGIRANQIFGAFTVNNKLVVDKS